MNLPRPILASSATPLPARALIYCNLANARSIPLAQEISNRFADLDRQYDIGELKIKISGCINACGHHHVGHIGILGVAKKALNFIKSHWADQLTNTPAWAILPVGLSPKTQSSMPLKRW